MDNPKVQLADKLKGANNILVTVSRNPSVDQLAACIGLTLLLTKLNKHAAAVFSGEVPSTLEFLQPEETIEKTTDSLRDFIIALDKSKADKLRYKVEDNIVRIFITPYRTSITQDDLDFSQGDFNVDVVVALGVQNQADLDEAITAHGRILHDATVAALNISGQGDLGTMNWNDPQASSLSELVTELAERLGKDLIDGQIATALLTGIVAETNRFSNEKTSPQTMSASATLMSAGANQQLVASKLDESGFGPDGGDSASGRAAKGPASPKPDDGTLEIDHVAELPEPAAEPMPEPTPPPAEGPAPAPGLPPAPPPQDQMPSLDHLSPGSKLITEPPTLGGQLSANTEPETLDPVTDPLSLPAEEGRHLLSRDAGPAVSATTPPSFGMTPPPPAWVPPPANPLDLGAPTDGAGQTLSDLESSVHSSHTASPALDSARDQVNQALTDDQPTGNALGVAPAVASDAPPIDMTFDPTKFGITSEPTMPANPTNPTDSNAPPPVPPPIPFQFGGPPQQ